MLGNSCNRLSFVFKAKDVKAIKVIKINSYKLFYAYAHFEIPSMKERDKKFQMKVNKHNIEFYIILFVYLSCI